MGTRLDIRPHGSDGPAGKNFVEFIDGDGTSHRFDGVPETGTAVSWREPAGVHLYLRKLTGDPSKTWVLTRPDRVKFFFDDKGYPTSVEDKNGNRLTFTLETVNGGGAPGGGNENNTRITTVTDQGGDTFSISYYGAESRVAALVRGKIKTVTDHSGSQLTFDYYDDGNLLKITQVGGKTAEGIDTPSRRFVFTYTKNGNSDPAIPAAGDRVDPNPKTPNQSTRLYSVRDPKGKETTFAYLTSGQNNLKLSSSTDRSGAVTSFAYDIDNRLTTVQSPDGDATEREHRYGYDTDGKLTSLRNPHLETTNFEWSADRHLTKVIEPTGAFNQFAYNDNGYLTERRDQLGNRTILEYENIMADGNDISANWKQGRTIPHISQLVKKTDPKGVATGADPNDFRWEFSYDIEGNLTSVKDPANAITSYVVNPNGTVASIRDPNGQPAGTMTVFETYDTNGCPTRIRDPLGNTTRMFCDKDGLVRWIQDPLHLDSSQTPGRRFATFFDFDAFHRMARQSTPKSSSLQQVIWTASEYDANDNVVATVGPHEAQQYTGTGSRTTATYDDMDRTTRVTGPDKSADPSGERTDFQYDKAGRLTRMTLPRGVQTPAVADDFVTIYNYDKLDRVISETRQQVTGTTSVRRTFYCYADPAGDLKWLVSPRSNQAASYNCTGGKPSHTTEYGYDAAHRVTSVKDPLFSQSNPSKHQEKFVYDANGNVIEVTNANGDLVKREYDQRNLLTKLIEPFGSASHPDITTAFKYDGNGNMIELISPRAWDSSPDNGLTFPKYTTKYAYDRLNRLVRVDLPSTPSEAQQYIHHEYDPNGNLLKSSLPTTTLNPALVPENHKTVMAYFDTGWIRTSNDPGPIPPVRFDYTPEGWQNLRVPQNAGGGDATSRRVITTYFPDGMPKEVTDRAALKHTYSYDANNNMTSANRLAKNGNNAMVITAQYDGYDQVAEVLQKRQSQSGFTGTTYTYDLNGNVATREDDRPKPQGGSLGAGRLHTFSYDAADRVSEQIDNHATTGNADDRRILTSFLPIGWEQERIVQRSNGSGGWNTKQTTNWTHFANGKLKRLVTKGQSGATIEDHTIDYTEGPPGQEVYVNGHRTVDEFTLQGPSAQTQCKATPCRSTFTYDPRDRLISHFDGQSGASATTTAYQLDTIGNVIREDRNGSLFRTFEYEVDRLKVERNASGEVEKRYFYDPYGNLECVTKGGGTEADCNVSSQGTVSGNLKAAYSHDELNRLIQFRGFESGAETDKATYDYDPLDRVVAEVETHPGATNDRTTSFSYLGLSSLVTTEDQSGGQGAALNDKTYGYDGYGNRITMSNTTQGGSTEEFTYAYDTHGSVSALVKQGGNGEVHASYGYGPYGSPDLDLTKVDDPDDDPLNPYRYSGRRLDPGSDSYDMGARRYAADPGRFLQQDLFMGALSDLGLALDPLTQNRYSFAGGNPISFAEWDGHMFANDSHGGGTVSGGGVREVPPKNYPSGDFPEAGDGGTGALHDSGRRPSQSIGLGWTQRFPLGGGCGFGLCVTFEGYVAVQGCPAVSCDVELSFSNDLSSDLDVSIKNRQGTSFSFTDSSIAADFNSGFARAQEAAGSQAGGHVDLASGELQIGGSMRERSGGRLSYSFASGGSLQINVDPPPVDTPLGEVSYGLEARFTARPPGAYRGGEPNWRFSSVPEPNPELVKALITVSGSALGAMWLTNGRFPQTVRTWVGNQWRG
jgi:RHS repeat-associated protein